MFYITNNTGNPSPVVTARGLAHTSIRVGEVVLTPGQSEIVSLTAAERDAAAAFVRCGALTMKQARKTDVSECYGSRAFTPTPVVEEKPEPKPALRKRTPGVIENKD